MSECELKGSLSAGDLTILPQQRPPSSGRPGGPPVRGAVLSTAGAAAVTPGVALPCPWQLPPRPMTQMIREHTDWRPKLSCALTRVSSQAAFPEDWRPVLR